MIKLLITLWVWELLGPFKNIAASEAAKTISWSEMSCPLRQTPSFPGLLLPSSMAVWPSDGGSFITQHIHQVSSMGSGAHTEEMALWRIMVDCLFSQSQVFHFHKEFLGCLQNVFPGLSVWALPRVSSNQLKRNFKAPPPPNANRRCL